MYEALALSLVPDGRRARGSRSRERITAALLALLREGCARPSVEAIAERAEVSRRTVFNHFRSMRSVLSDLDEQQVHAVSAAMPRIESSGTLEERVSRYCVPYAALLEAIAPVRWAGHLHQGTPQEQEQIRRGILRVQAVLSAGLIELLLGAGVDVTASPPLRRALDALVDPMTFRLLRVQQGLSHAATRDALAAGIVAIAEAASRPKRAARRQTKAKRTGTRRTGPRSES